MPVLRRPPQPAVIELPPRKAEVAAETDVLVVGGGPAGIGAALGAAAAGSDVVVAERYGFLGGNATAALVMPLMSFHTQTPKAEKEGAVTLLPTDHGRGEAVIAGVVKTLLERLVKAGGATPPSLRTGYTVPFDPEIFKWVAMELLDEAGVHFLFHSFASEAIVENRTVNGVVFETKSGPVVIRARVVLDCTGDGDVAARAGAPFEIGRQEDRLVQPMTLMFRMVEFERRAFEAYVKGHPDQWKGVHGLWDLIRKASAAGELELPREDMLFFATPHEREVSVNSTRVTRVLGTDVWDLSYAEWQSRRQMRQIAAFLQRHVPGFEKSYAAQSGVNAGVRETRRIVGDYQLSVDDILNARKFPDVIARSTYPVDIHNPEGTGTLLRRVPAGESYDIPLRCLLPQDIEGLVVAGRCISGTHEAHSSYRVMPVSMATGQAAGACASLAAESGKLPREISASEVQAELVRQGADLGAAHGCLAQ
ncbi:MAG: FAD-dependent oxidoreductase [Betaproteobacteria bacterium]|nr:FAD-dependent oxidoreductase [Betaproteobacteria bacterium]